VPLAENTATVHCARAEKSLNDTRFLLLWEWAAQRFKRAYTIVADYGKDPGKELKPEQP